MPTSVRSPSLINILLLLLVSLVFVERTTSLVALDIDNDNTNTNIPPSNSTSVVRRVPDYWPRYDGSRRVELLDGLWNFSRLGSIDSPPIDFDSMDPNFAPDSINTPGITSIPSCVDDAPPGFLGYRGVSFFRKQFVFQNHRSSSSSSEEEEETRTTDTRGGARIQFQACSFYCRVWVNGVEIGDHRAGGYVAFWLDVPPQEHTNVDNDDEETTTEIFVLVDNRFNKTTAPMHTGGDFWHYGGIMRSVEWHAMPPPGQAWPWRLYVAPEDSLETVRLSLRLMMTASKTPDSTLLSNTTVSIAFDDGPSRVVYSGPLKDVAVIEKGEEMVHLGSYQVPNAHPWSPLDPHMHTVRVEVNGAIVTERFGLRTLDIDPETARIRLNGQFMPKLVGWNHHTQWPDT